MRSLAGALWFTELACLVACGSTVAAPSPPPTPVAARPGDHWQLPRVEWRDAPPLYDGPEVHATFEAAGSRPRPPPRLVTSWGERVTRRDAHRRELRRRGLNGQILRLIVHPRGAVVWQGRDGRVRNRLSLLDPDSLADRWVLDDIVGLAALTASHAYAIEAREEARVLVEIALRDGTRSRELPLTGDLVGRSMQHGDQVALLVRDERHTIAAEGGNVLLMTIDLAEWTHQTVDLGINLGRRQGLTSRRVVGERGATLAYATLGRATSGLLWVDAATMEVSRRPLPDEAPAAALVQHGPSLVVLAGGHAHLLDTEGTHRATLRFPGAVTEIVSHPRGVWLDVQGSSPLLMLAADQAPRVERIRTEPWRFGEPAHATDQDARTVWRFLGEPASIDLVFDRPTIVPALTLTSAPVVDDVAQPSRARLTFHNSEFGERTHQLEVDLDANATGPQALVQDLRVAHRVSIEVQCTCVNRRLCNSCQLADIGW